MINNRGVEEFQEMCRREFQFLEDYGFVEQERGTEKTKLKPLELYYVSPKTSILIIGRSYRSPFYVMFGPAERAAQVGYPAYDLGDLLQIRRPDLSLEDSAGKLPTLDEAAEVRHYALALKETADDVLRGDFSIAPQIEDIIERRRKELRRLDRRKWLESWKSSWQGCMRRWWRKRRARARR